MAKKAKDTVENQSGVNEGDLRRIIKEATRQKNNAAEVVSSAGAYIKNQLERLSLHAKAFKMLLTLNKMEVAQRNETLRNFFDYTLKAGFYDQMEMFDESVGILEKIVARIRTGENKKPEPDDHIASMPN